MKQIKLTQNKFTLVDDEDYDVLSEHKWYLLKGKKDKVGYAVRWSPVIKGKRFIVWMAKEILNIGKGTESDHINRNSLDNRKCNLRITTRKENNDNRGVWGTSKYRYVYWDKSRNKWVVRVKGKFVGRYKYEKDAIRAVKNNI